MVILRDSPTAMFSQPTPQLDTHGFDATQIARESIVTPGSQTAYRLYDANLIDDTGATVLTEADVLPTEVVEDAGAITFESLDTDIATVDANGQVTRVSDGMARILVKGTYFTRQLLVTMSQDTPAMVTVFDSWADGSLAQEATDAIDTRLVGADPSTDKQLHDGSRYSAACWANNLIAVSANELNGGTDAVAAGSPSLKMDGPFTGDKTPIFDGVGVEFSNDDPVYDPTTFTMTIRAKVNFDGLSLTSTIYSEGLAAGSTNYIWFYVAGSGKLGFICNRGGSNTSMVSTAAVLDAGDGWHDVAVRISSGVCTMFIDASPDATTPVDFDNTKRPEFATTSSAIGCLSRSAKSWYAVGGIADVEAIAGALTDEQIAADAAMSTRATYEAAALARGGKYFSLESQSCEVTNDGIDLTGVSIDTPRATLITPRHIVMAKHYAQGVGSTVSFLQADGTQVDRTITGDADIEGHDVTVATLDSDVPVGLSFVKIAPSDLDDYLPDPSWGIAALVIDQDENALVADLYSLTGLASYKISNDATRKTFYESLISGDSGSPSFLIMDDEPVLISTAYFSWGGAGPMYHDLHTELATAIAAADADASVSTGYTVTVADLSAYHNYLAWPRWIDEHDGIHHWIANDGSANDRIGGLNLTNTNATLTDGLVADGGQALAFDDTAYLDSSTPVALGDGDKTISVVFTYDQVNSGRLIEVTEADGDGVTFWAGALGWLICDWKIGGTVRTCRILVDDTLLADTRYHVAASFAASGNVRALCINGAVVSHDQNGGSTFVGLGTRIGARLDGNQKINGVVGAVVIYDRIFTPAEFLEEYQLALG